MVRSQVFVAVVRATLMVFAATWLSAVRPLTANADCMQCSTGNVCTGVPEGASSCSFAYDGSSCTQSGSCSSGGGGGGGDDCSDAYTCDSCPMWCF